jgi:hypothetical protein
LGLPASTPKSSMIEGVEVTEHRPEDRVDQREAFAPN